MNLLGVILVIAAGFAALLASLLGGGSVWEDVAAASSVCEVVKAWEDKGLHATRLWRAREALARQWWLGPLRADSPTDPLMACGLLQAERHGCTWWRLLLQPQETRQLLACLEERVAEAEGDLVAFSAKLWRGAVLGLVVAALGLLAACCLARRAAQASRGLQDAMSEACGVPATGAAGNAHEDISASALMEQWATPAADKEEDADEVWATPPEDMEEEVWVTPPEEMEEEEVWVTPPLMKKRRRRKNVNPASKVEAEKTAEAESVAPKVDVQKAVPKKVKEEKKKADGEDAASELEVGKKAEVESVEAKAEVRKALPKKVDEKKGKEAVAIGNKPEAMMKEKVMKVRKAIKTKDGEDSASMAAVREKAEAEKAAPKAEVQKAAPKKVQEKGKEAVAVGSKPEAPMKAKVLRIKKAPGKFAEAQHRAAPPDQHTQGVRQSWQEAVVAVQLPVPPPMRKHVIGPQGDTVRQLRQDYPGVHVAVPALQDKTSAHISIRGPKSQAAAAAQDIAGRLAVIETQTREAERRRQEARAAAERRRQEARAQAVLDVAPNMRRFVVGYGGEELRRLSQQHPAVRVSVPPPSDTESRSVTIRGPPAEVAAVQASITAHLEALERKRQRLRERNRRRRGLAAAKRAGAEAD